MTLIRIRWVSTHRFCDIYVNFAKVQGFNPAYLNKLITL